MRLIFIILYIIFSSNIGITQELFKSNKYILTFNSNNISLDKEVKINEIKVKAFKKILTNILSKNDLELINISNILFINNFILNLKINNEKIVNNNYFSEVTINFNKYLIIKYLINNKISFVDFLPNKFLIIILEQNSINDNLLSKENNFYKYLILNKEKMNEFFLTPKLDHNDKYIYNKENFLGDNFDKNNKLNDKYNTNYQILVQSINLDGYYNIKVYLYYNNNKYLALDSKTDNLNYEFFFKSIKFNILEKWKELNKIDVKIINSLDCKININNISELSYVRKKLEKNIMIKSFNLKTIRLNENIYQILFFGNISIFINSLKRDRLKLFIDNNSCNIKFV